MTRFLFVPLAALTLSASTYAAEVYATYTNARFGYRVLYPANLVAPRPESDNGDGRKFKSRDGKITLSVWGENNALGRTLRSQMETAKRDWRRDNARVTYWRYGRGFYVVSGTTGDQIFYEKTVPRGDGFATILWQYPKSQKARLDEVVTRTTKAFG